MIRVATPLFTHVDTLLGCLVGSPHVCVCEREIYHANDAMQVPRLTQGGHFSLINFDKLQSQNASLLSHPHVFGRDKQIQIIYTVEVTSLRKTHACIEPKRLHSAPFPNILFAMCQSIILPNTRFTSVGGGQNDKVHCTPSASLGAGFNITVILKAIFDIRSYSGTIWQLLGGVLFLNKGTPNSGARNLARDHA